MMTLTLSPHDAVGEMLDVVRVIADGLDDAGIAYVVGTPAVEQHHTLGQFLRNNLGLWDEANPLRRHCKETYGVEHPDDISGMLLDGLSAHLKGLRFDFDAAAKDYVAYWAAEEDPNVGVFVFPDHAINPYTQRPA